MKDDIQSETDAQALANPSRPYHRTECTFPILITGSHRSGTTWVGRVIAANKSVIYIHEPFNLDSHDKRFAYAIDTWYLAAAKSTQAPQILSAYRRMLLKTQNPWHRARTQADIASPIEFLKSLAWAIAEPRRVLLKDPIALMSAEWLEEKLCCKVICMIRNPLAFVSSLVRWNWTFDFNNFRRQNDLMETHFRNFAPQIIHFSENEMDVVDQACLLWNLLHLTIAGYKEKHPDWLFLRHEDLVATPDAGFKKIFDYIDLPYTNEVQQALHDSISGDTGETESTDYRARDSKGVLDTWKSRLTPSEVVRVIASTKDIASNFYQINNNEFV